MKPEVIVIGSGMGSLAASAILCSKGWKVTLLEQGKVAGGCSSSFEREGFIFESGATTLVGLDAGMPLDYVLKETGIKLNARLLETPMRIFLKDGSELIRYRELDKWISEAERVFGLPGQESFWRECYQISQFVWDTSLKQISFPPSNFSDLMDCALNATVVQLKNAGKAFISTEKLLIKHGLHTNIKFREFVDEQLIITAQNSANEVNALFGATALCYTNFGNYYLDGGLITMINKITNYLKINGSEIIYNSEVIKIDKGFNYFIQTAEKTYQTKNLISGIPINNLYDLLNKKSTKDQTAPYSTIQKGRSSAQKLEAKLLPSKKLSGAFTMGLVINGKPNNKEILHHQIVLSKPITGLNSKSIFISFSHPNDSVRTRDGKTIANVSTHVHDPEKNTFENKDQVMNDIIDLLINKGFFRKEQILYSHATTPKGWENWTKRKYGFVGGYPQFMKIKPWQMQNARLEKGLYLVGDSVYPGQGIPGVTLSGIIAANKLIADNK